jgi:Tfp pilus assembly protein PilW
MTDETAMLARDEAVLDMQNNARAALTRINADLRRTGFFGCGGELSANTDGLAFPPTAIGFNNNDAAGATNVDDGTDAITLAFLVGDVPLHPVGVTGDALTISTSTTKEFTLARQTFDKGDALLITDCEEYAIFIKTNCSDTFNVKHTAEDNCPSENPALTTFNSSEDLLRAYGSPQPARVYSFASSAYRIENADLMLRSNNNGTSSEVAANIEDLQFEFIEDLNQNRDLTDDGDSADPDGWRDSFTNLADVRAVRVWVLAMSDPAYTYTDTNTYDYPNSPYSSATSTFSSRGVGSPASQAGLANNRKHRYRYLASSIVYLRNAGII